MAEINNIVKLALDNYRGRVENYSKEQSNEALRQALIEANGGSTKLDYRKMRDGKCGELFTLIEEILKVTVVEALQQDDFFMSLVDFRNVAEGDKNIFEVEDANLFVVAKAADGTQAIRRQRLGGYHEVQIDTEVRAVRIYEELNRILAGRVDFNDMINKVAESFKRQMLDDVYALWKTAADGNLGGETYFPEAGEYDEDELLDLIAHVEAAAGGKTAMIIGTKKAIRNMKESIQADSAKEELHEMGYYGKFYGTPVMAIPQRHKVGTTEFVFDDDVLFIVAGDEKPIKFVYEGDPLVIRRDATENMDLTEEYFYAEKYGLGVVLAGDNAGIGRYEIGTGATA